MAPRRTMIVAASMSDARHVAAVRGWPRSSWRFVYDGSDIRHQPRADLWVDPGWAMHPRADSIADAIQARLNPEPYWFGQPRPAWGTGTLEQSKEAH